MKCLKNNTFFQQKEDGCLFLKYFITYMKIVLHMCYEYFKRMILWYDFKIR